MNQNSDFKETPKQREATKILAGTNTHAMLYGGSRSGKTFKIVRSIIIRACKTKSRHAILRLKFNHAKRAIWLDTLPKVMNLCFPDLKFDQNKADMYLTLANGSEIWVGGLDDKERSEKILGQEYSTIFFNECSQIPFSSIKIALTRLAEKNSLKKRAYYDENPPSKRHWSYPLFIKGINPDDNTEIDRENYKQMLMNPSDNLDNIDPEYFKILDSLSEEERMRFKEGLFQNAGEGVVYYGFDRDKNVKDLSDFKPSGTIFIGMDFNVDPLCYVVLCYINKTFYVFDEGFLRNSNTFEAAAKITARYRGASVIPDSTGKNRKTSGKSDHDILKENGLTVLPTRNPFVTDRINNMNRLLESGRIVISKKCEKLIKDLEQVSWKEGKVEIDKGNDHLLTHISDALGYATWKIDPITHDSVIAPISSFS